MQLKYFALILSLAPAALITIQSASATVQPCDNLAGHWQYLGGNDHKNNKDLNIIHKQGNKYYVKYYDHGVEQKSYFVCVENYDQATLTFKPVYGGNCIGSVSQDEEQNLQMWSACKSSKENHLNYYFYKKS